MIPINRTEKKERLGRTKTMLIELIEYIEGKFVDVVVQNETIHILRTYKVGELKRLWLFWHCPFALRTQLRRRA